MSQCTFCGIVSTNINSRCQNCNYWPSYYENLFKDKLPKKLTPFTIDKNNFEYKKNKYSYHDIKNIEFDTLKTNTYLGAFMKVWESDKNEITIYLGDKTVIKESRKSSNFLDEKLVNIFTTYNYLSELSFTDRLNRYIRMLKTQGYFTYDSTKFFIDGRIETRSKQNILLSNFTINNYDSFFQLTLKNPGVFNIIGEGLSNISINSALWKKRFHGDLTIHTIKDKDVFYALMLRIYKIKFPL